MKLPRPVSACLRRNLPAGLRSVGRRAVLRAALGAALGLGLGSLSSAAPADAALTDAALAVGVVAPSLPPPSPAQLAFDQVNRLLREEYAGLSPVDRRALGDEYQARLNAVCRSDAGRCAAEQAYPVIEAQLTALGDSHSFLQWPDEYQDFVSSAVGGQRLQFGFKLAALDGERRLVTEVVPGSAAEAAGLRRGDVLQTLDGQPYTYAGVTEARERGRPVTLTVRRLGQLVTVRLQAGRSSAADLPRLEWPGRRTALLRIPTFLAGGEVAEQVHRLVAQARSAGAEALVVDLRGNAGGSLLECDLAASAFVPAFSRVAHSAQGRSDTAVAFGQRWDDGELVGRVSQPQRWRGPLAVLVDHESASCAEFFAYEVQRLGRGAIVGTPTAGVGNTATRVFPVGEGAGLQLTVLHYAKPAAPGSGAPERPYPQRIEPDVAAEDGEAFLQALAAGRDLMLEKALGTLRPSLRPAP